MNTKNAWIAILTAAVIVFSANAVWAGGQEGGAPSADQLLGPEIWAVLVVDCETQKVIIRAKEIDDCIVGTEAFIQTIEQCPAEPLVAADMVGQTYEGLTIFDNAGTPVIMKVKNFQTTNGLYSFDALINFLSGG